MKVLKKQKRYRERIYQLKELESNQFFPIIIADNNIVLEKQVATSKFKQFSKKFGVDFIDCLTREGIVIKELFHSITSSVINDTSQIMSSIPERT